MVERATRNEVAHVSRDVTNVHIGCNLPNGVELQLYRMVDGSEMTPQGPRPVKRAEKKDLPVRLRGVALKFGVFPDYPITNGYAVTVVSKDFWDQWVEQNGDSDLLANRCLLAGADTAEVAAKAAAAKQDKVKSGMAPIDPKAPPSVGGGLKVQQATG